MRKNILFFMLSLLFTFGMHSGVAQAADTVITGTVSGYKIYDSNEGIIFQSAIVAAGANVSADAAYEVRLKPGTRIASGARLAVRIKDMDGLSNRCEMASFGDLTHLPNVDDDGDGLTNLQECQAGTTSPKYPDSDNDGVGDECERPYDTTAPTLAISGSESIDLCVGDIYNDPGATASDNCLGNISGNITVSNPVNTRISGTYLVTYNVQDGAGNPAAQLSRTVHVDTQSPVIALNGDNPLALCVDSTYQEPGASATDNCGGDISGRITINNPVNMRIPGNYTVMYNVTDAAGNPATVDRTVVVIGDDQTVQINTIYDYDAIGRLRSITKKVQ